MKKQYKLPFQNLTPQAWLNLLLAATVALYLLQIITIPINESMCEYIGYDYCAYWSAGKIMNAHSIADVYNLERLAQYQKPLYPSIVGFSEPYIPVELPYLPVFILPFQLLSLINLPVSFLVWTIINLLGFILYIRFFIKHWDKTSGTPQLIIMALFALPIYKNVHYGQLNIWLGICAGEFFRMFLSGKTFKAGIWLGGGLLKPQLLILILPFLLIKKSIKALGGFAVSTSVVIAISFGLVGTEGFIALKNILLSSAEGAATSNPQFMMNWRMLGWHIGSFTSSNIGWTVAITGSIITALTALIIFSKNQPKNQEFDALAIFGVFSATCLATWHAHSHMALILVPPILGRPLSKK